ncbi:MAG: hypothetical protein ACT4PZ_01635 [Panacagrimonas sp.]
MLRLPSIWLLCFGLVLSRLLGMHVHACAGTEGTPHQHQPTHYADSGFFFGESHADDHSDNLELELTATVASSQIQIPLDSSDDPALPDSDRSLVAAAGWMTVRVPRGPPAARDSRPTHFAPPPRGPPSRSLA